MSDTSERAAGSRAEISEDSHGFDPLLAVQLSDRPRYDSWSGELRLALAVVEDAIATVRLTTGVRTPRAHRLATDAAVWLASRDTSHPYAFENLCDYLGLNAAWLRTGLRLQIAEKGPSASLLAVHPEGGRSLAVPSERVRRSSATPPRSLARA